MKVNSISFGQKSNIPANHEEMQNKALLEIWKHYEETGNYSPARIDYFENGKTKITYLGEKKNFGAKIKNFLSNLIKKVKI